MVNYLNQLKSPQINHKLIFEVMRDLRKGGLNPSNFEEFMQIIEKLPPINLRTNADFKEFEKLGLVDVSQSDFDSIIREVIMRCTSLSKKCWHPLASSTTCNVDSSGNIIISGAHSIQNNGVLSLIAEDSHVVTFAFEEGGFYAKKLSKNVASIFLGFCNTHDSIFKPIEIDSYIGSEEQHFLFAYRGFVVGSHKKLEVSRFINYGTQSENDIKKNKEIFDNALLKNDFSVIETKVVELPVFYPIAVSSMFYLDFDFEGNPISHSDERMEFVYVTLLPTINKTYFLISYLKRDNHLYGHLGDQMRRRNKFKSDISIILAVHTGNIFFNPTYYDTFIKVHEQNMEEIFIQSQIDIGFMNDYDDFSFSITPKNYLDNPYEINLFGY